MTDNPRFDDLVIYLIPIDLYAEILALCGLPYAAVYCTICSPVGVYAHQTGGEAKNLLDLLHELKSERGDLLANELYSWLVGDWKEPEPPELQGEP